jgi:uridylate kinase
VDFQGVGRGFDRVEGDKMGMLSTVINSIGLAMFIRKAGVPATVFTATPMEPLAKYYMRGTRPSRCLRRVV